MLLSSKSSGSVYWKCPPFAGLLRLSILISSLLSEGSPAGASAPLVKSYEVENSVYKMCCQSDELLAAGSYAQARDVLQPATANDPTSYSAAVHSSLARANRGLKDYDGAVREAQLALKFNPQRDDALYTIALAYNDMGSYGQAVSYLERLLARSHDETYKGKARELIANITVYRDLKEASACIDRGQDAEAKRLLERAATHDPSKISGQVHSNLAYVLRRTGQPDRAIVEGEKALKFDPSILSTMYTVGIAYQDIGKFDDAIIWLQKYAAVETDEERRRKANDFAQELMDDKAKLNPTANARLDYLDQSKAADEVHLWPQEQLPIKFYINPSKSTHGYRPIFRTFVIRALDTWFNASGKKVSYVLVDDPKLADVKLKFVSDELPMQENNRSRQKAGLTIFDDKNDKQLSAKVRIRTVCGFDTARLIEDGQAATVCMHEVGHALGLGHSTSFTDVMYFGSSSRQPGMPSARDIATIRKLYGDYPVTSISSASKPVPGTAAEPVKFMPPPMFAPPKPVDLNRLAPPVFLPPPIKTESEKLLPPMFVPPPKEFVPPVFTPPPLRKTNPGNKAAPPMFMPPPK